MFVAIFHYFLYHIFLIKSEIFQFDLIKFLKNVILIFIFLVFPKCEKLFFYNHLMSKIINISIFLSRQNVPSCRICQKSFDNFEALCISCKLHSYRLIIFNYHINHIYVPCNWQILQWIFSLFIFSFFFPQIYEKPIWRNRKRKNPLL